MPGVWVFFSLCQPCDKLVTCLRFKPIFVLKQRPWVLGVDRKWMDGWMRIEVLDHRGPAAAHIYAQCLEQTQLHFANAMKTANITRLTLEEFEQMEWFQAASALLDQIEWGPANRHKSRRVTLMAPSRRTVWHPHLCGAETHKIMGTWPIEVGTQKLMR